MIRLFSQFAKKWRISPDQVNTIYLIIQQSGDKYGKSHRIVKSFGVDISVRQMRYFYKKCRLYQRLDVDNKGKPKNMSRFLKTL